MTPAVLKRVTIGAIIVLGTALILALYLPGLRPDTSNTTVEGSAEIGGPFQLINQDGESVTEDILLGKYSLVYFGFTYCPDICPLTLQSMADAIELLPGQESELVQPIFISLDPERDTPQVVASYVDNFHPRMIGLTGSPERVREAASAYRVFFRKSPLGDEGDYTVDHSGFLYLMNRSGKYIDHFRKDVTVEQISARLRDLL